MTGNDFRATYNAIMNKNWDITSREGWEDISRVRPSGKSVTVTFRRPFAAWKTIVGSGPLRGQHQFHRLRPRSFARLIRPSYWCASR